MTRPTTRLGRIKYAAQRHPDPAERPRDGWKILHFRTEKWERQNPDTGRVEMAAKRLSFGWWFEVHERGQQLANVCVATRGEAMRGAEAVPPFQPYDWRQVPDDHGEIWMRQYETGAALTIARWDDGPWKTEGEVWSWCVSDAADPRDFDPRYDWGGADTMQEAKAAAETAWTTGPNRKLDDGRHEELEA